MNKLSNSEYDESFEIDTESTESIESPKSSESSESEKSNENISNLHECPKGEKVNEQYCKWYVKKSNPDPSWFTLCEYCYENLNDIEKEKYQIITFEGSSITYKSIYCDSEEALKESKEILLTGNILLSLEHDNNICNLVEVDGIKKFDVPTGKILYIRLNTNKPDTYLFCNKTEYNGIEYEYDLYKNESDLKPYLGLKFPVIPTFYSKREIKSGAVNDDNYKLKIFVDELEKIPSADDIISRPCFKTIKSTQIEIELTNTQSENNLYKENKIVLFKSLSQEIEEINDEIYDGECYIEEAKLSLEKLKKKEIGVCLYLMDILMNKNQIAN